jgi:long-chain fatty acid transport protein
LTWLSLGGAVSVNFTRSQSEVAINSLAPGVADGRLETTLDGIGTNLTVSALWQVTERTRLGIVYSSAADAELEGDLDFKNPGPVLGPILESLGLIGADLEIDNTLPQRLLVGVYHELSGGRFLTADVFWTEFSEFGTSSVSLNGDSLDIGGSSMFDDVWGVSLGYGWRTAANRVWTVGAFHLTAPVSDDDRGLALALDRIWALGVGVSQPLASRRSIDLNVNLIDYGEAPVDTGPSPWRGRVVGRTEDPYALLLDVAYHF